MLMLIVDFLVYMRVRMLRSFKVCFVQRCSLIYCGHNVSNKAVVELRKQIVMLKLMFLHEHTVLVQFYMNTLYSALVYVPKNLPYKSVRVHVNFTELYRNLSG